MNDVRPANGRLRPDKGEIAMQSVSLARRYGVRAGRCLTVLAALAILAPPLPAQSGWDPGWFPLGNVLIEPRAIGRPVVGTNADGRQEVFVVRSDNALWHVWQGGPNGGWANWESLGGFTTSNPAVERNQDGRQEVFIRGGDEALYHKWQVRPNAEWSGWDRLGGPQFVGDPTVGRNKDGRLEVFVRARNNSLWHVWQVAPNGQWSAWNCLCSGDVLGNPVVQENADGRLEVFYRGADRTGKIGLISFAQSLPNGINGQWTETHLGDLDAVGARIQSDPGVAMNADGRLEAFVRGHNGTLFHRFQRTAGVPDWAPWEGLLGDFTGDPVPMRNRGSGLSVFLRGFEGALYEQVQLQANSSNAYLPQAWRQHGRPASPIIDFAVGRNSDGRLEVHARTGDGAIVHHFEQ
jgi:hypothetical protein